VTIAAALQTERPADPLDIRHTDQLRSVAGKANSAERCLANAMSLRNLKKKTAFFRPN